MNIPAEKVAESLINGSRIHRGAMEQVSLSEVTDILHEQGHEVVFENGFYSCRGSAQLAAAKAAKDAAEKAQAALVVAQEKAVAAQAAADAAAAKAAAIPSVEQPTSPFIDPQYRADPSVPSFVGENIATDTPPQPWPVNPASPPFVEPPVIPSLSPERPAPFVATPPPPPFRKV
jgi:hypothetical protein